MDDNTAGALTFLIYIGSLAAVSIYGLHIGWYHALWVWVVPLLTGFRMKVDCSCDCAYCEQCTRD